MIELDVEQMTINVYAIHTRRSIPADETLCLCMSPFAIGQDQLKRKS